MKLHANPFQRAATVVNPYIPSIRNLCLRGPLSTPPVVSGRITKIGSWFDLSGKRTSPNTPATNSHGLSVNVWLL